MVAIGLRPAGLGRVVQPSGGASLRPAGNRRARQGHGPTQARRGKNSNRDSRGDHTPTAVGELTVRTGLVVCQPIDHAAPIAVMQAASPLGSAAM